MEQRYALEQASTQAQSWLKHILDVEHHSNEVLARALADSPLKPFWVAQAQAILFYTFGKNSLLLGRAKGHGFLVTRCAPCMLCALCCATMRVGQACSMMIGGGQA